MVRRGHGGQILSLSDLGGRLVKGFIVPDCVRVIDVARVAAASSFPSFLCKHGTNPRSQTITTSKIYQNWLKG